MFKALNFLLAILTTSLVYGQTDSLSKEDRLALDSMFRNDEFIKLMMARNKSYFDVNIAIGNGTFSLKNNALNAGQAVTNKIFYTPSVGYYNKSGFSISASGFLTGDEGKLKMYQYAITPSYVYTGKRIDAGISYTRFIKGADASFNENPFKNDFYGTVVYKKTWIEPGVAIGYSFGRQEEYFDTAFWLLNRVVHIRDTIKTRLSGFSVMLYATHKWSFFNVAGKKDAILIQPTVFLNAGSQKWNTSHSSSLNNRRPLVQNYLKTRYGDGTTSSSFNLYSLAFLAELTYYLGKFYCQPQVYLDYYLPSTSEKRLTTVYSVTTGFSF